jgi:hypothetical protein
MTARQTCATVAIAIGLALGAAGPGARAADPSASIVGKAWNADNSPVTGARLRLRNAVTGKIDGAAVADAHGQFRFDHAASGTYIVELVDESGKVLAVGHVFSVAASETVATFVRLSTRVPWYEGFFANAAAAAIATAASEGITALAPVGRPVSRKQ